MPEAKEKEVLRSKSATPEKVKGNLIVSHLTWVRERLSPSDPKKADLSAFWKAIPEETRNRLEKGVLAIDWYPFEDIVYVDKAIVQVIGKGDARILEELGEQSAEKNVPEASIVGDAHRYFQLHAKMHDRFQNYGKSEYESLKDGGRLKITGYQVYSPVFCRSALGFFRKILERFGYQNIDVSEPECHCRGGKSCTYEFRWTGAPKKA